MSADYTDESLQLAITEAVCATNECVSFNSLLDQLFGVNAIDHLSKTLKIFVRRHYVNQLKVYVRYFGKKYIYEQLKAGSSKFIKRFGNRPTLIKLFDDVEVVQARINRLVEESGEESLLAEFTRYFNHLRNRLVPLQVEETFRLALIEWFQSGEMTKQIRNELNVWFKNGVSLNEFRNISLSLPTDRDCHKTKVFKAAELIKTDQFMQIEKLTEIAERFLTPTIMEMKNNKIRLHGRTIFLSDWICEIEKQCKTRQDLDVEIYATDCCGIDCNIILNGINLVLCSNRVYVWRQASVVLSGVSNEQGKSKANSATYSSVNGTDGKDGHPGQSSGNFHVYAKDMVNVSFITVFANGGRGQDGDDGGDGYNGEDGVGISKNDLEELCVKYSSLYFNWWTTFRNYSPPKDWKRISCKWDQSKQFGYEEYEDEHGRKMTYSFAGDVGYIYTTYHLFFLIRGSEGGAGTQGGRNGVGGDGGYRGNVVAENPETGEVFPIKVERNMGQSGINGICGKSGRCGINGNDMVLIDRSVTGGAKDHIGSSNTKLVISYDYEAETNNRLDGYRKNVTGKNACFAKFSTISIDTTERRAQAPVEHTERSRASKAVAKKSVLMEAILSQAEEYFKADDAFLADACKQTVNEHANNHEEIEKEETDENVSEEVTLLRQCGEPQLVKYTLESEKRTRPKFTSHALAERIKTSGHFTSIGTAVQNTFDLFSIEMSASQLENIRFSTMFQKNRFYHAVTDNKFSLVVISAQQDRLVDGKNFNEIIALAQTVTNRRQRKYTFAKFCEKFTRFVDEFESSECQPNLVNDVRADKLFGVQKMACEVDECSKKQMNDFFGEFSKYRVELDLLKALNDFYNCVGKNYAVMLEQFSETVDWTNKHSYEPYFNLLQAWLRENDEHRKQNKEKNEAEALPPVRDMTELEVQFEAFVVEIHKEKEYFQPLLEKFRHVVMGSKEYIARFGEVPTLKEKKSYKEKLPHFFSADKDTKDINSCIEPALFVIRLYWLSFRILTYMRHLYNCNELFAKEEGKLKFGGVYLDDGNDPMFDNFVHRAQIQPLDIASEACELYMDKYGIGCASVRYLLAHKLHVNFHSYVETGYQEVTKKENFNSEAEIKELLWISEHNTHKVNVHQGFRDLDKSQEGIVAKYNKELQAELAAELKYEYSQLNAQDELAQFYTKPFRHSVIHWLEGYIALTHDQTLLGYLHNRFYVDGCHMTPFDLQFTLLSAAKLQKTYRCCIEFIILLCSSVPQNEIINVMVYMQITYRQVARFQDSSKIYGGIRLIESARHKALFIVKLEKHDAAVDYDQLYKLILMLQHSSNGSEQLENMTLHEWISIANRQKWSEIGALIKQYGDAGFYLGFLDDRGKKDEEIMLRQVFDSVQFIPELFIALIAQLIANGEVKADKEYFNHLRLILETGNDCPGLKTISEKRPYLITSEAEQQRLIEFIYKKNPANCNAVGSEGDRIVDQMINFVTGKRLVEFTSKKNPAKGNAVAPEGDRTVDQMINLVSGLHDITLEAKQARKHEIDRIGKMIKMLQDKTADEAFPESMCILRKYDEHLHELHNIRLRHTQKMAVLYAVESEKNLLEQVNTGEGKSYIIAAIAIIRCKIGYKHVDIITSSPVLAKRDAEVMRTLYAKFGLSVGHNCDEDVEKRKKSYESDIVYGDMVHFQRDYLLHTFYKKNILGDRTCDAVIVDEVDNMLLDNSNNMLYLSHSVAGLNLLDSLLIFIHKKVYMPIFNGVKTDVELIKAQFNSKNIKQAVMADIFGQLTLEDVKAVKSHKMTKKDVDNAFNKLIQLDMINTEGYLLITDKEQFANLDEHFSNDKVFLIRLKNMLRIILDRQREINMPKCLHNFVKLHLDEFIENGKRALFMSSDHEYVVDVDHTGSSSFIEPRVTIIDSNTGADLATSQWTGGLHQLLQLKHGCRLSPISLKAVFVSNVAYLRGYQKINGLSGTLGSKHESETLIEMYNADLVKIPTFKTKFFYEHVPVIATCESEWFQSLFDEVCDQVMAGRSVLIICESIAQVRTIHSALQTLFKQKANPPKEVSTCFESITIYEREFNNFNFSEKSELDCSRLIIATNLAGRGTDIKLSKTLIDNHGLHVITSFLPANCRIEEQAFGRAARCGQPGSAQIIAMRVTDSGIQPSVFQLKMFRDNQEVHRLTSLKSFYDFHTEIEEKCLEKFRHHCSQALSAIYSSKSISTQKTLPTPSKVVYFALLDKWALWLDRNTNIIEQCAKNHSENEKTAIIDSVDEFLSIHRIDGDKTCYEIAKEWIDFPQSLITLGIIQMSHKNGFQAAENTFDRILIDGSEFAAEVYYFKACMRMRQWSETRPALDSIEISPAKDFAEDIDYAIEYFHKSRTLFMNRVQLRQQEGKTVAQFLDASASNHIKTCGFAEQLKSITTAYQLIIANIDWILGIPCKPDMFLTENIPQEYAQKVYESFTRQGVISPELISLYKKEDWQLRPLRHKFKMSKKNVVELVDGMKSDGRCQIFDDDVVLDLNIMAAHVKLSDRINFWMQLKKLNVFVHAKSFNKENDEVELEERIRHVLLVDEGFKDKFPQQWSNKLSPVPPPTDEELRYQIRLSNETEHGLMYAYSDVVAINDENLMKEIDRLVQLKALKHDLIGQINVNMLRRIGHFDNFDGVTTDDIADFFEIDPIAAAWIVDVLTENGVLKRDTVEMHRFTLNEKLWNDKINASTNSEKDVKNVECSPIHKHTDSLNQIRQLSNLKNVTPAILCCFCEINNDEAIALFKLLSDERLLEPIVFTKFRLYGKLDCSCLPSAIANEVDEFLSDRFAYTFALENLCAALDDSFDDPRTLKKLFLQEQPHDELFKQLLNLGIGRQSHISQEDYSFIDFSQYKYTNELLMIINEHRTKLYDQTHYHMEFVPVAAYFDAQGHMIDPDVKAIIENGLRMVITKRDASIGWSLQNAVVKAVSEGSKKVWSGFKACGNFIYKVGSSISQFVQPFVEKCVDAFDYVAEGGLAAARYIKKKLGEAVQKIADTEIVQMATQTINDIASAAGEIITGAVEAVGNIATATGEIITGVAESVGNAVITVADQTGVTAVARAVGSAAASVGIAVVDSAVTIGTKVYNQAKVAFHNAMSQMKNVYRKMSSYVTATVESYQYYNQCRFGARRLVIEQGVVDEHFVLQNYDQALKDENRTEVNDNIFEQKMRDHVVELAKSWLHSVNRLIKEITMDKFSGHHDCIDTSETKAVLESGQAIRKFNTEVAEHLMFMAAVVKVAFFNLIKVCTAERNANLASVPLPELGLSEIKTECERLAEFIKLVCEEVLESRCTENQNNLPMPDSHLLNSCRFLEAVLQAKLKALTNDVFVNPTIKFTTAFLASCRNRSQLATMSVFSQEDLALKKAVVDFNSITDSKKNADFLLRQLQEAVFSWLTLNSKNKELLHFAIKSGFPLPVASVQVIAIVAHTIFSKHGYGAGFELCVFGDNADMKKDEPLLRFKTSEGGKMKVNVQCVNGQLFICQRHYQKYTGNKDVNRIFLYEGIMQTLKMLRKYFPKHDISFCEELLQNI